MRAGGTACESLATRTNAADTYACGEIRALERNARGELGPGRSSVRPLYSRGVALDDNYSTERRAQSGTTTTRTTHTLNGAMGTPGALTLVFGIVVRPLVRCSHLPNEPFCTRSQRADTPRLRTRTDTGSLFSAILTLKRDALCLFSDPPGSVSIRGVQPTEFTCNSAHRPQGRSSLFRLRPMRDFPAISRHPYRRWTAHLSSIQQPSVCNYRGYVREKPIMALGPYRGSSMTVSRRRYPSS